jgi:hypothetical protein
MIINPTAKTPYINFNQTEKQMEIKGISCPENPVHFYNPIFDELRKYIANNNELLIRMQLDYFNTGSSKCILNLFQIITENTTDLNGFKIIWVTEEEDDELKEAGKIFEEMSGLPFEYENAVD